MGVYGLLVRLPSINILAIIASLAFVLIINELVIPYIQLIVLGFLVLIATLVALLLPVLLFIAVLATIEPLRLALHIQPTPVLVVQRTIRMVRTLLVLTVIVDVLILLILLPRFMTVVLVATDSPPPVQQLRIQPKPVRVVQPTQPLLMEPILPVPTAPLAALTPPRELLPYTAALALLVLLLLAQQPLTQPRLEPTALLIQHIPTVLRPLRLLIAPVHVGPLRLVTLAKVAETTSTLGLLVPIIHSPTRSVLVVATSARLTTL